MKRHIEARPWLIVPLHIMLLCVIVFFLWLLFRDTSTLYNNVIAPGQMATTTTATSTLPVEPPAPVPKPLETYLRVTDGCGIHFEGSCALVHSGPGVDFPVVAKLRNDIVLRVGASEERGGHTWYQIVFDEGLIFPERVKSKWYVAGDFVEIFKSEGVSTSTGHEATSTKRIVVSRAKQTLTAYDGGTVFMSIKVSTGLLLTPTPRGVFTIFRKTPTRYMQGPLPGANLDQYYDLPGVPWNLYFTKEGAVIHGAYWHDSFGKQYSHGCVNLSPLDAEKLYNWADLGMKVVVID